MSPDPLDALHRPHQAVAPRTEFAEALRRSLEEELGMTTDTRPSTAPDPSADEAPIQVHALRPGLSVSDGAAALAFYQEALGAVVTLKLEDDEGHIGHAELQLAGATFTLGEEFPDLGFVSPQTLGGTPINLTLDVSDVDAATERAVRAGATVERPPADQFHGNRTATVLDPFGHRWTFRAPSESLSLDELARRAEDEGYRTTASSAEGEAPDGEAPTHG